VRRSLASTRTALLFALVTACACTSRTTGGEGDDERDNQGSEGQETAPPPSLDAFTDGRWTLRVDRTWDAASADVALPSDALSEDDYRPATAPAVHTVVVSGAETAVTVGTSPMRGSRAKASSASAVAFELTEGTFAGGRFVVWQGPKTLEAELTLYGSGRPIVESHRGELVRAP
jgi:hypothetical protein